MKINGSVTYLLEVLDTKSRSNGKGSFFLNTLLFCLFWGITAQSTQWGHVERGQFTQTTRFTGQA